MAFSDGNRITDNEASNNVNAGISLSFSDANTICLNNFIDNADNAVSIFSRNTTWHSPSTITYTYNGNTRTKYLGNYWGDYKGSDSDGDGIGDSSYGIDSDADYYPLMKPWANYVAE